MEIQVFTAKDILNIFKKRAALIIFTVIFFTGIAYFFSNIYITDRYLTCCKLFAGVDVDEKSENNYTYFQDMYSFQSVVNSYSGILMSYDVIQECIENTDVTSNPGEILRNLTVKIEDQAPILDISISTEDPYEGEKILTAITEKFNDISKKYISKGKIDTISKPLISPVDNSSKKQIFILVGFGIGVLISTTISLIVYLLDDTIKEGEEVEKLLKTMVISKVPKLKNIKYNRDNKFIKRWILWGKAKGIMNFVKK